MYKMREKNNKMHLYISFRFHSYQFISDLILVKLYSLTAEFF